VVVVPVEPPEPRSDAVADSMRDGRVVEPPHSTLDRPLRASVSASKGPVYAAAEAIGGSLHLPRHPFGHPIEPIRHPIGPASGIVTGAPFESRLRHGGRGEEQSSQSQRERKAEPHRGLLLRSVR
jgi:hypothetical protein